MNWIIDRFEGDLAVVEAGEGFFIHIPRQALPSQAKEGDILAVEIDARATADRKAQLQARLKGLNRREEK